MNNQEQQLKNTIVWQEYRIALLFQKASCYCLAFGAIFGLICILKILSSYPALNDFMALLTFILMGLSIGFTCISFLSVRLIRKIRN